MSQHPTLGVAGGPPVLVIGAGFIGGHVAEALVAREIPTRVVTRSAPRPEVRVALEGADLIVGDTLVPSTLEQALDGVRHVVFCAGTTTPADSVAGSRGEADPAVDVLPTVLTALRERPQVAITYLSSGGTVYGQALRIPIDESHPTEPIVPYGAAKLAGERHLAAYRRDWGVRGHVLRCANVYGERQRADRNQGAVAVFLDRLRRDLPLVVVGDGSVVRDYVYVRDLASAIVALIELEQTPDVMNVGSGRGTSVRELIRLMEEITGRRAKIEQRPSRSFDVSRNVLDIARLRATVPYDPLPLRTGLERTWDALSHGETVAPKVDAPQDTDHVAAAVRKSA